MLSFIVRIGKLALGLVGGVLAAIVLYLGASLVGAMIPATPGAVAPPSSVELAALAPAAASSGQGKVYLLTTLLHADFAIAADERTRARFAFLAEAGFPIGDPALKFLVFGWGSRAFYTQTPHLADIRPGPTVRAIVGDEAVTHVMPAGDIRGLPNALAVPLPPGGLDRLTDFIEASFEPDGQGDFSMVQRGFGAWDAFYAARGRFNVFRPCNVWVGEGLRAAGVATGLWTPTTHALKLGLSLHGRQAGID